MYFGVKKSTAEFGLNSTGPGHNYPWDTWITPRTPVNSKKKNLERSYMYRRAIIHVPSSDHTCTKLHVLWKSCFERNTTWLDEFDCSTISKLHVLWFAKVQLFMYFDERSYMYREMSQCVESTCSLHVVSQVHVLWAWKLFPLVKQYMLLDWYM